MATEQQGYSYMPRMYCSPGFSHNLNSLKAFEFQSYHISFRHAFHISTFSTSKNQVQPQEKLDQRNWSKEDMVKNMRVPLFMINNGSQLFHSITFKINTFLSHQVDESEVKEGDHIYLWRSGYAYSHHGIYVGNDTVVHVLAAGKRISGFGAKPRVLKHCKKRQCGNRLPEATVFQSCLSCFKGDGPLCLYKYGVGPFEHMFKLRGGTCTTAVSKSPKEVSKNAKEILKHGFGEYNLVENNCEDFGIYCKTNLMIPGNSGSIIGMSGQGNSWFRASGIAFVVATVASAIMFLRERKIEKRRTSDGIGTIGKGKIWFRVLLTFNLVAAVTFFVARHVLDIGVRPDAVRVELKDFLLMKDRKPKNGRPPRKKWCEECEEVR